MGARMGGACRSGVSGGEPGEGITPLKTGVCASRATSDRTKPTGASRGLVPVDRTRFVPNAGNLAAGGRSPASFRTRLPVFALITVPVGRRLVIADRLIIGLVVPAS